MKWQTHRDLSPYSDKLYITCSAPATEKICSQLVNVEEHLAAKEPDNQ